MSGFFITGTDTEIGKTYVTCLLLRDLRARGFRVSGYKPLACGDRGDALAMVEATGLPASAAERVNPVYLRAATAPYIAAELERRRIQPGVLTDGYRALAAEYEPVLVEGAGGWEVPIAPGYVMADLAKDLGLPVIVVVGNKLGAVNHALMTVKAVRAAGLECRSLVLNHMSESWDTASVTNRRLLEEFCDVPVAAELIYGQTSIDSAAVLGI